MADLMAKDANLEIRRLALGAYDNNAYLLTCLETAETLVVDAPAPWQDISKALGPTRPTLIAITHHHTDHTAGLPGLRTTFGVPIAAHAVDAERIPGSVDQRLCDGDVIRVGTLSVEVLHTPGHTPGSICLRIGRYLFSGDTLFPGGPGNTRSDVEAFARIIESIRTRLFTLPDDTVVYPGHGRETTIGAERPHLDEWIARGW